MSAVIPVAQIGDVQTSDAQTSGPTAAWQDALNVQQRAAATVGALSANGQFESAPLLIIAGAGTGKTNTLAHRVAHLRLNGVAPDRILLLTFTRRAAAEMTRRAERILQQAQLNMKSNARARDLHLKLSWAGTFHSIANRILRQRAPQIGLDPSFSILDRGDAADLLDIVRQELGFANKDKRFPRKDTCLAIYSHKINTQWTLKRTLEESYPWCC
jgi:DNA helicase-2/ATP-dependent DNA helicase PcrA